MFCVELELSNTFGMFFPHPNSSVNVDFSSVPTFETFFLLSCFPARFTLNWLRISSSAWKNLWSLDFLVDFGSFLLLLLALLYRFRVRFLNVLCSMVTATCSVCNKRLSPSLLAIAIEPSHDDVSCFYMHHSCYSLVHFLISILFSLPLQLVVFGGGCFRISSFPAFFKILALVMNWQSVRHRQAPVKINICSHRLRETDSIWLSLFGRVHNIGLLPLCCYMAVASYSHHGWRR